MGEVELTFMFAEHEVSAAVVIAEEANDPIFGLDWLGRYRSRWSFAQNIIEIDGRTATLISRHRRSILRRLYAAGCHVISAGHTSNVSVTMAVSSLHQMSDNWAVEAQSTGTEISAARTSMRAEGSRSAVQATNISDSDFVLRHGEFIGEAEQVTMVDNEEKTLKASEEEKVFLGGSGFGRKAYTRIGSGGRLRRCSHPDGN